MKIVFSRKGWDSSAGGGPSPIFPNGSIHSLPIPEPNSGIAASSLTPPTLFHLGVPHLGPLFSNLSGRAGHSGATNVHVDPVPDPRICAAGTGITDAAFGQDSAAASHLDNQGVGVGSLFLFFGLFRRIEKAGSNWRYVPQAPAIHLVWAWLHVGRVVYPGVSPIPAGLGHHPHVRRATSYPNNNRLYLPSGGFILAGKSIAPSGVFGHYHPNRQLTQHGRPVGCSDWELPTWLVRGGKLALSYHGGVAHHLAAPGATTVFFRSVGRGQEFVFDHALNPAGVDRYLGAVFS